MKKNCENCQSEFETYNKERKYCGWDCFMDYKSKNVELFSKSFYKKGCTAWNKGTKGLTKANKTSFKKGCIPYNALPVGSLVERRHWSEKHFRRSIKIAEPDKWQSYSHYTWEKHFGEIPKGHIVHHKDRDALNDNIENLELMSRAKHLNEHRNEHDKEKKSLNQKKAWIIRRLRKEHGLSEKRIKSVRDLNQVVLV